MSIMCESRLNWTPNAIPLISASLNWLLMYIDRKSVTDDDRTVEEPGMTFFGDLSHRRIWPICGPKRNHGNEEVPYFFHSGVSN